MHPAVMLQMPMHGTIQCTLLQLVQLVIYNERRE